MMFSQTIEKLKGLFASETEIAHLTRTPKTPKKN